MNKGILIFLLLSYRCIVHAQMPEYDLTCKYACKNLSDDAKTDLSQLLGKRSLEVLARNIPRAAQDTIDTYTRPLKSIHLAGPYKMRKLDSMIRPLNLNVLQGLAKFERVLSDTHQPQPMRLFALQVLIGIHTIMQQPLLIITIVGRDEFIKHDIFPNIEMPDYRNTALITFRLYDAYKLGLRVAQAAGNQSMVTFFKERGYENAGRALSGSLNQMAEHIEDSKHPGVILERVEGPNWGKIIKPGEETIYYMGASPGFPGGMLYFYKALNEHLQYPEEEWNKGIQGEVFVQTTVEKDGIISDCEVVNHVTPDIDAEAVKAIKLIHKMEPGHLKLDGPAVRTQFTVIANFRIALNKKREDAFNIPFHDNIKPEFPGGKSEFLKYIKENSEYTGPPFGRVTLQFVVDQNGKVSSAEVLRSLSHEADAEALRLLRHSPPWRPGLAMGIRKTSMGDTLSIQFPVK